ncbi:MBL fold metallo-hydrolase [Streptomyces sp. NPDC050704]|uniref:MBL fold metallo-hydrolase n=1 Tax=Streptomyces sp. NPDC050704 TaxID=3157219 RepID=UPI003415B318
MSVLNNVSLPDYAPIPAAAFGPEPNELGYYVAPIGGNLYWVTDQSYQAMFLSTRTGVVLVDAPPSLGHNLVRAIEEVTRANGRPSKVTHLVYSHYHADHIGAAGIFDSSVERVAHVETDRLLKATGDRNRPRPTTTFGEGYTLSVGGERLQLDYRGPNHTPDNIFIHVPDYDTLFVVDVMYPGWAPFQGFALSQEIPNWIKAHREITDYSWSHFLGGHVGRPGTREDAELLIEYVDDLLMHVKSAIMNVDPAPYFTKYGGSGNPWAMMKHYWNEVARQAAEPVVAKYTGKLAAADVTTVDNAFTLITSLQHDDGFTSPAFGIRP